MTTTKANITTATHDATTEEVFPDFGNGRYSNLQLEAYKDIRVCFGLTDYQSERLAKLIGSDYGSIMAQAKVTMKHASIGRENKDGKVTVKEASTSLKNQTLTFPLFLMRTLNWLNEANINGINRGGSTFILNDKYAKWLVENLPADEAAYKLWLEAKAKE